MASLHLLTLPPEVLHMICTCVFEAERVVTIGAKKRSRNVNGDTPALLHVNHQLRQLAIENYGSVFSPREESQEYGCSHRWGDLNYLANLIGIDVPGERRNKSDLLALIQTYLKSHVNNTQPLPKHFVFAKKYWPAWFNPQTDVVLFEPQNKGADGAFDTIEFQDSWTRIATKIRKVAFAVDVVRSEHLSSLPFIMKNPILGIKGASKINPEVMSDVESITVLVRHRCEVVNFQFNEDDLLKPREWSFKLNTKSQRFQDEMGDRWANVTWEIRLARDGTEALWPVLRSWAPPMFTWLRRKRLICMKHPEVAKLWYTAQNKRAYDQVPQEAFSEPPLMENGDGKTYMGPSNR